jgi:hypothetical protein
VFFAFFCGYSTHPPRIPLHSNLKSNRTYFGQY